MKKEIEIAINARKNAHSPYNKFSVGAVLKTKNGKIYTGCNIDNQGLLSICAERTAFVKAISEGETEFDSITVVGGPIEEKTIKECIPCGYCRQFMSEFVDKNFKIITLNNEIENEYTINELLPNSFNL